MAIWPLSKIKSILQSIDMQLKGGKAERDDLKQALLQLEKNHEALRREFVDTQLMEVQRNAGQDHLNDTFSKEIRHIGDVVSGHGEKMGQIQDAQLRHQEELQGLRENEGSIQQTLSSLDAWVHQLERQKETANQRLDALDGKTNDLAYTLQNHQQDKLNDHWMMRFGYDGLISNLQLAAVELQVPGNRARLEALRDTHKGERCFVIGNGPSLQAEDLDTLKKNRVFSFASKRITAIYDQTSWRPDVWGVSDLDFIHLYHEEMDALSGYIKIVPCQAILNLNIAIENAIYFPFIQMERTPTWFNADVTWGVHFWGSITPKLINFAVYMGFTEIYLLGVDNSVPIKTDESGKKYYDTSVNSHFSEHYYDSEKDFQYATRNIDDMERTMEYLTNGYKDIKFHCDALGVKIYNATRGGELEVYPRVGMDTLFDER